MTTLPRVTRMVLPAMTLVVSSLGCLDGSSDDKGATSGAPDTAAEVVASASAAHADGRHQTPRITAPPAALTARWWQWVISIGQSENPLLDPTGADCAVGQEGPVWFLGGTFGGPATRSCTVPAGKALLIPVLNVLDGAVAFDCEPSGAGRGV